MSALDSLFRSRRSNKEDAEHWIGISDLMSGLMMMFLFIAVAFSLVNLLVDLLYAWLDPRIKAQYR